jgi:hypothetical protein
MAAPKPIVMGKSLSSPQEVTETIKFPEPEFKGTKVATKIHPDFEGMFISAGWFGGGKTLLQLSGEHPQNILFIDMEMKGKLYAKQHKIENYFAPTEEATTLLGDKYKPIHLFQRVTQILRSIPQDRFTWVILDGMKILQEGLAAEVTERPKNYGVKPTNAEKGSYGGVWPGVGNILTKYYAMCQAKGVKVLGITCELRQKWSGDGAPIFNKFEISGVGALNKFSILTVVTTPGPAKNLGVPSGLVIKEALAKIDEEGNIIRRLPVRLPKATMNEIYNYLDNPADWSNPKEGEVPSKEEMEPFSSFVGKEQMGLIKAYLEAARAGLLEDQDD